MAVQEDVLRIKKSLEKMMLNKSVVKLHKFVRRFWWSQPCIGRSKNRAKACGEL